MNSSLGIKAITLDLDDTLWDIWSTMARAEQRLHEWLAQHHPAIPAGYSAVELRELTKEAAARQPEIAHDRSLLRKAGLRLAADRTDSSGFCEHKAFEVLFEGRNDVLFFADALPALEHLQQHFPLAAVTNGNADVERIGIARFFEFVLASAELGVAKPDPEIFLVACERLGVVPQQVVHIGDDPELDIIAAAEVGMRTVWVNRNDQTWPGGQAADAEIRSLAELEALLAAWD